MTGALPDHGMEMTATYDEAAARIYDILELDDQGMPTVPPGPIIDLLSLNGAQRILDMTCGTGAQCIALAAAGFEVTASDISPAMVDRAHRKAAAAGVAITFAQADMRDVSLGRFDAIISMYNAIGHLSTADFARTLRNAAAQLEEGGLYVFDIFDRAMMGFLPCHEFIDRVCVVEGTTYVRFSRCEFREQDGITTWRQRTYVQAGVDAPEVLSHGYTLRTYARQELLELVLANGFDDVEIVSGEKGPMPSEVGRLLHFVVARKRATGVSDMGAV